MQYISSIIIGAVVVLIIALIIRSMIKAKKSGRSLSCGSNCSSCAMSSQCHKK